MDGKRREELIERAARQQFRADHPEREWLPVEAPSSQLDERARYLVQAEEYLITHGIIARVRSVVQTA